MKRTFLVLFLLVQILLMGCGNTDNRQTNTTGTVVKNPVKNVQVAKTYDRWTTVKMNDEIEFQIPPNLEIQEASYKNVVKKADPRGFSVLNAPDRKRMVAQQKGLNDFSKEALSHYVRAVMEIVECPDEFPKFGEPLNITQKEAEEFGNTIVRKGQEFPMTIGGKTETVKVVSITTPARVMNVNGVECIFLAYDSKLGSRPIVKNDVYFFFNKRKIYRLMTMIRSTEYNLWTNGETDIRNIVQTIKLIK